MPGIDPNFICHHLSLHPNSKPVAQKKRKMSSEKQLAIEEEIRKLLEAGIIRDVQYT